MVSSAQASLRELALEALQACQPAVKLAHLRVMHHEIPAGADLSLQTGQPLPGRPAAPVLVAPARLSHRSPGTPQGHAALIHSLAHIEFNAINLALDIMWRFPGMPEPFYTDWLQVALEEGLHFELLVQHLATLGHAYGDFPAHDGLWEMAERTSDSVLARLALVPRTLEARGLDASPLVRRKLAGIGDQAGAAIIDIILRDEIGHVATGNRWYRFECERHGLDPVHHFSVLARQYRAPVLRGPFNLPARRAAGFSNAELQALQNPVVSPAGATV